LTDVFGLSFYEDDLKDFLDNPNTFQEHLQKYDPENQGEILARIEQEIQHVTIQKK
jgi:hypothetical protein